MNGTVFTTTILFGLPFPPLKPHVSPDIEGASIFTPNLEGVELDVFPSQTHVLWSLGSAGNSTASLGKIDDQKHEECKVQHLLHVRKCGQKSRGVQFRQYVDEVFRMSDRFDMRLRGEYFLFFQGSGGESTTFFCQAV